MKKKLLSLVLAGAMVASTSVSAFAKTITDTDSIEPTTEITITGKVASDDGQLPAGRFNVTIPTTASFTVKDTGEFIAPETIVVQNDGDQKIDVYAYKFTDSTPDNDKGITVVGKNGLAEKNRTNVSLNIVGNGTKAYLGSNHTISSNGIYSDADLSSAASTDGTKIATVAKRDTQRLTLEGEAGKKTKSDLEGKVASAVNDTFTLTLKIKKSTEQ